MKKKFSRRSFVKKTIAALVGLELGYLAFDILRLKSTENRTENLFNIGHFNQFEKGKLYPFSSKKFYLSVFEDGGMLAISLKCTHLGCMLQPDSQGFMCPCHASSFNQYGEVLSPPANRPLDIFPIVIKEGEVWVNTSNPVSRKRFEPDQLTYS
jgi:Rieske Fe-S protein